MCGIAGAIDLTGDNQNPFPDVRTMVSMLKHRGPETTGVYHSKFVHFAHARLSIIDLEGGLQPIPNEDRTLWVICNGEFYNFIELREFLTAKGHQFLTASDTEVLLHLYEEIGDEAVNKLNGQFGFALWDSVRRRLLLGRDRFGIRPLFYAVKDNYLLFASEVKALLAAKIQTRVDFHSLAQVFTTWSPLPGKTMLKDVSEVLPGHIVTVKVGEGVESRPYWQLQFPAKEERLDGEKLAIEVESIREALTNAVKIRLRADVPVGAYLSGGLDSTFITSLAQKMSNHPLHTFSITFDDPEFDESEYQYQVAHEIGTIHHIVKCDVQTIRRNLPDVVWHTETPVLRLAPVPMYLLAQLVNQHKIKVVLTGEGADEFFGGYDIFREAMVRRFIARDPTSNIRPLLLKRLYAHLPNLSKLSPSLLKKFYCRDSDNLSSPYYSHTLRWDNTYRASRLFSKELLQYLQDYNVIDDISTLVPKQIEQWSSLSQAQYLESVFFLSSYLLSSQGDRMAMAHAVEGRYPFLDHRLIELINQMPSRFKINGLRGEKYILKLASRGLVPDVIRSRSKYPYRAPVQSVFSNLALPDYAKELLSTVKLKTSGCFDPVFVQELVKKIQEARFVGEMDQMAFVGILTYQIFHDLFIEKFNVSAQYKQSDFIDVTKVWN